MVTLLPFILVNSLPLLSRDIKTYSCLSTKTYSVLQWQQFNGSACQRSVRVCGWIQNGAVTQQNNWLFTQHIRLNSSLITNNFPVAVIVEITYDMSMCPAQEQCRQSFGLLYYSTSEQQLGSTTGRGFLNTRNYASFAQPRAQLGVHTSVHDFNISPTRYTGFYLAVQDTGSCIEILRMKVYHKLCPSFQTGLVLYPDVIAPSHRPMVVSVSCVENAHVVGSASVTCATDGSWGSLIPVCQCGPGYTRERNICTRKLSLQHF